MTFIPPIWPGKNEHPLPGVVKTASSVFSAPSLKYSGSINHANYLSFLEGQPDFAKKGYGNLPKSSLRTKLGSGFTTAWHRSHMVNIGEARLNLGFKYGTKTAQEHLFGKKGIKDRFLAYAISGGNDLLKLQREAEEYYQSFLGEVENQGLHIGTVKDSLIRKGFASSLSIIDITSNITSKSAGKGIHQLTKLATIESDRLREYGFSPVVQAGAKYEDLLSYISKTSAFVGIKGNRVPQFSSTVFYAVGSKANKLGDSFALGSRKVKDLYSRDFSQGGLNVGVKKIHVGALTDLNQLSIHKNLKRYALEIMQGNTPRGMTLTPEGTYVFNKPKTIIPSAHKETNAWLGDSVPVTPAVTDAEKASLVVGAPPGYKEKMKIRGIKYTPEEGGMLSIEYIRKDPAYNKARKSTTLPALVGTKRLSVNAGDSDLYSTKGNRLNRLDLIVRGKDFGLDNKVSWDFLSERVLPHFKALASQRNKLEEFANRFGLGFKGGATYLKNLTQASPEKTKEIFETLLSSSDKELRDIGLTRAQVHGLLKKQGDTFGINPEAIEHSLGMPGLRLLGQPTAIREGMVSGSVRPGAFRFRMHDLMSNAVEQMGLSREGTNLHNAYKKQIDSIRKHIFKGGKRRLGKYVGALPDAAQEIASVMLSQTGRTEATGGLFKGMKSHAPTMNIHDWYAGTKKGNLLPAPDSVDFRSIGASESQVANTIHAFGENPFTGLNLELGTTLETKASPGDSFVSRSSKLYIPTDKLLGISSTRGRLYLRGKGLRDLRLGDLKKEFMQKLHSEMLTYEKMHGSTQGYQMSESLKQLGSKFQTSLRWSMVGKKGLLYHQLTGTPGGAFRLIATPMSKVMAETADNQLVAYVNPIDLKRAAKNAGYKNIGRKSKKLSSSGLMATLTRYPMIRGQNVGFIQLIANEAVNRGTIAVHQSLIGDFMGDFDWDQLAGYIDPREQASLKTIHSHRSKILSTFAKALGDKEIESGRAVEEAIIKDLWEIDNAGYQTKDEFMKAVKSGLVTRHRGAAGGGTLVGPVYMGYSRLSAVGKAIGREEGASWINALEELNPGLAQEMRAFQKANPALHSYIGALRETGIYGTLKKGASGFGTNDYSALEALMEYGKDPTAHNKNRVVLALEEGFKQGYDADLLRLTELGIDPKQAPNVIARQMTDILTKGEGHEGILTISKAKAALDQFKLQRPLEEAFRGRNPMKSIAMLGKQLLGLSARLIGGEVPRAEQVGDVGFTSPSSGIANDAMSGIEHKMMIADQIERIKDTAKNAASDIFTSVKDLIKSPWGQRVAIGAGAVIGLGILDSIFGSSSDAPEAPMAQAPIPPRPRLGPPDQNIDHPDFSAINNSRPQIARIERPNGYRTSFNVESDATIDSNITAHQRYMGNANRLPTRSTHISDHRYNSDEQEMNYQIRRRLESSF